jgi:predicted Zn-dependent protease
VPDDVVIAEAAVLASHGAPHAWHALAEANRAAGRLQGALAACEAGLNRAPSSVDLLQSKAETLRLLGRLDAAAAAFRAVLAGAPGHDAARFGLALVAVEAGELETARLELAPLAKAAPGRPDLRWLAARIALLAQDAATARAELEQLLRQPLPPAREADAQLLLAEACDQLGDYSAAFTFAAAGKALQRQLHGAQAGVREGMVARLQRLETAFSRLAAGAMQSSPAAGRQPERQPRGLPARHHGKRCEILPP